jgi:hypothetical protein
MLLIVVQVNTCAICVATCFEVYLRLILFKTIENGYPPFYYRCRFYS